MEINKETALRLWNSQFGKTNKAEDFAGRVIAKAAYNDRNSKYGWNVDHIFPVTRGGKTADYNLICCHIQTNDEKADKFPCFKANDISFEIKKRQNHYEIFSKNEEKKSNDNEINLMDYAQGLDLWSKTKKYPENFCVGYVKVQVKNASKTFIHRFRTFLGELFNTNDILTDIFYAEPARLGILVKEKDYKNDYRTVFTILDFDLHYNDETQNLFDGCTILNTYSQCYFEKEYDVDIRIICAMDFYVDNCSVSRNGIKELVLDREYSFKSKFAIDDNVYKNTDVVDDDLESFMDVQELYDCDYFFTELKENLEKL